MLCVFVVVCCSGKRSRIFRNCWAGDRLIVISVEQVSIMDFQNISFRQNRVVQDRRILCTRLLLYCLPIRKLKKGQYRLDMSQTLEIIQNKTFSFSSEFSIRINVRTDLMAFAVFLIIVVPKDLTPQSQTRFCPGSPTGAQAIEMKLVSQDFVTRTSLECCASANRGAFAQHQITALRRGSRAHWTGWGNNYAIFGWVNYWLICQLSNGLELLINI